MNDPVTKYAQDVVDGIVIAGPHVRNSCKRHLNDLEIAEDKGWMWDLDEVHRVINFFKDILTVEVEYNTADNDSVSEAVPFILEPSQVFIIGSLFGWKREDGIRRFRRAYVEIGKGNGKSPLAAGIGHYMLSATGKLRAEVYCAATDKDQAAIPFRDAVEMWRRSPELFKRLVPSGQNPVWQLTNTQTSSFYKPISSEKRGKSGIRPYCAVVDEVHEHPDNSVIEILRAGTKGNRQALIFEITNSGFDRNSVCWSEHNYTTKVCSGELENDSWFGYISSLDESDNPFEDESCWVKANPLLGVSIFPEFIREQVNEAKGMPSKEALVRRLHFCQWVESEVGWIPFTLWQQCEREMTIEQFWGKRCWAGLDLSYTIDLSALAWVFDDDQGGFDVFCDFWKPKDGLYEAIKRDSIPYDSIAKKGFLELTDGKVIKLSPIAKRMQFVANNVDLQGIAYDQYRHKELVDSLFDLGVELPMVEHPQGFRRVKQGPLWMPNSIQEFENAVIEGRFRVHENPLLRANIGSVVIRQDPAGTDNKIFDKRKSTARIDGAVAIAMGIGLAKAKIHEELSVYETRGVVAM